MNQQSTPPHRIELPTGLPVPSVNVYLFTEPEPALVDTGTKYPPALQALQAGLAQHGLAIADLARVIISHPHVDHFGLAGYIAAHSPARIHVLQDSVPWLVNYPPMWRERVEFFGNHLFKKLGLPDEIVTPILAHYAETESMCESVPAERIEPFDAGDHLSLGGLPWQVLHTPGHTNTLTCFFQPGSRQFLSTDMLLPLTPTPIPDPPPPGHTRRAPGLPRFIESLRVVEALDIGLVLPGHGEPFTNHRQVIQRQRERIQLRKTECLKLVQSGHSTADRILLKMYAHYPPEFRFAGLWMIVGYLDLLKAEGAVIKTEMGGVWHYRPA